MPGTELDFCKITEGRVTGIILRFYNVIYCKVKNQVTKKHFYKYYVFSFLHLIKRKSTLMFIWGSALTKFKIENQWGKFNPAYSFGNVPVENFLFMFLLVRTHFSSFLKQLYLLSFFLL